jgi:hypothetical protein
MATRELFQVYFYYAKPLVYKDFYPKSTLFTAVFLKISHKSHYFEALVHYFLAKIV